MKYKRWFWSWRYLWMGLRYLWLGVALLDSLSSTQLLFLCLQLTWPTSSPINCSIKARPSSLLFASVCLILCGHSQKKGFCPLLFFFVGSILKLVWSWILGHGCAAASSKLPFVSSKPCQDSQSGPVLFSLPQPIGRGSIFVTAINIIFPGQQSVSLLLVSISLHGPAHVISSCCVCGLWVMMRWQPWSQPWETASAPSKSAFYSPLSPV